MHQSLVKAGRTRGAQRCVLRVRRLCNKERERNERKVAATENEEIARAEAKPRFIQRSVAPGCAGIPLDGPPSLRPSLSFDGVVIGIEIRR